MKYNNILETIGDTPHIRLGKLFPGDTEVWMKAERFNPGASIKDRIGLAMIEDAEKKRLINKDTLIIEPTSGNTGIGLALVCAVKGYRLVLTMPESMSIERRRYLKALGAELVLTPKELGMGGCIEKANQLLAENDNAWMPQQFNNPANPQVHRLTTAEEIWDDTDGQVDILIAGVGTGGTITGVADVLKKRKPGFQAIAVEPIQSPVLTQTR
ncbi:hypothetical protein LCGC14_2563040, partial [marine sediment metagenome]